MTCIALIPARGGSKGVPKKNVKLLAGFPLIAYSIAAAKLSKKVDRVIVSTDCPEIAEIAKSFGADVPFLRPTELAQDFSPDIDAFKHACTWLRDNERGAEDAFWLQLRPTTPFRDPNLIDAAIDMLSQHPAATSLRSSHKASETPFKWYLKGEDEYYQTISSQVTLLQTNLPRQKFPHVYVPNGYVDIVKPKQFMNSDQDLNGSKILSFETPHVTEVDTLEDFQYLAYQSERSEVAQKLMHALR